MHMNVASLVHITPDADEAIAKLARVSNPSNEDNRSTYPRLIRYLIDHNHWSPFETVHATVEVWTTRDIGRQLLRHRSFSFQEFSGRYAAYSELMHTRDGRFQDTTNRQNSLMPTEEDCETIKWWNEMVAVHAATAESLYQQALEKGIAKECARAILPEGLVPTRMYVCGSIRSFIHYCKERLQPGVQYEHQLLAGEIFYEVFSQMPLVYAAIKDYVDGPSFDQILARRQPS
jgi:thymidylate synthase (FAD)